MPLTIREKITPLSAEAILRTIIKLGESVFDTLTQQAALRYEIRGTKVSDEIDPDYTHAPRAFKEEDVGKTLTYLCSVYDADGNEVVNAKGQVVATLTNDNWSTKRAITVTLAKELSEATGSDIRAVCAEAYSMLTTAALEQGNIDAFDGLDYTECVGTEKFEDVDGQSRCACGVVCPLSRWVASRLYGGYSRSHYAARLVLVGEEI